MLSTFSHSWCNSHPESLPSIRSGGDLENPLPGLQGTFFSKSPSLTDFDPFQDKCPCLMSRMKSISLIFSEKAMVSGHRYIWLKLMLLSPGFGRVYMKIWVVSSLRLVTQ